MNEDDFSEGTLGQLSAYFVMQNAEKSLGWKADDVKGLTSDEIATAARLFAKYDANDDNKLEMSEFKKLCDAADFTLSDEEVKAAISLVDKRGSGFVEFDEFVAWWAGLSGPIEVTSNSK
jgi:calmodulin